MKKYLAITAALALALTACGQTAADSTPTPTAATEATAAPAEQPQSIGSGALRLLTAAADGVYYQVFNDWEINYTGTKCICWRFIITMKPAIIAGKESIPTTRSGFCWRRWSQVCP